MTPFALLIPAAGSGRRMGTEIPKPFLDLGGKRVIEHAIHAFYSVHGLRQIIVVVQPEWIEPVQAMKLELPASVRFDVVEGGDERSDSVRSGLSRLSDEVSYVAIHDAVRPFVDPDRIRACLEEAARTGAAILAVPARDTIKQVDPVRHVITGTPDRETLWHAQTPQIFERTLLEAAYHERRDQSVPVTDDASIVEAFGHPVAIVQGSFDNFKLTWPVERLLAERMLEERGQ